MTSPDMGCIPNPTSLLLGLLVGISRSRQRWECLEWGADPELADPELADPELADPELAELEGVSVQRMVLVHLAVLIDRHPRIGT